MYVGCYKSLCRGKNRIAFPARLRKQTGDSLYITNWFEQSLMILPKSAWEKLIQETFNGASFLTPEARDLDRFIFGGSYEVELDREGRFVLPAYLKEYSRISKDVIFTGGMWYIQLWDLKAFEDMRALTAMQIKNKAVTIFENLKH